MKRGFVAAVHFAEEQHWASIVIESSEF